MEIAGKIIYVSPRLDGVSKMSGTPYSKQDFVIESAPDMYGRTPRMAFSVFGEQRLAAMDMHEGDSGTLHFDINAHEHNGRWYNDIMGYMFTHDSGGAGGGVL